MSDRIAHYNILSTVGSGAPGPVYRARDTILGRTVAIRVLTQGMDDPAQRACALDLVQPYTALTHQHVASLFEAGEQRGSIYLVYEFISGERLNAVLAGHPMNLGGRSLRPSWPTRWPGPACLVHGALTASGVIVTPKGHAKSSTSACPPVCRNAAAMTLIRSGRRPSGRAHQVIGRSRVVCAAPEQLLDKGRPPGDLFALGALLHEMVTAARVLGAHAA
jgi:serine/threonine-protein kinase